MAGVEHCERRCCEQGEAGAQEARTHLVLVARAKGGDAGDGKGDGAKGGGDASDGEGGDGACAVLASPEHGRTHQVRLHCARAGAPLLADTLYNPDPDHGHAGGGPLLGRHALHAYTLRLPHPTTGVQISRSNPRPPSPST